MKTWESRAKYVEQVYGGYVNWEERFFQCPQCEDLVYEWDDSEPQDVICPICWFYDEDENEE